MMAAACGAITWPPMDIGMAYAASNAGDPVKAEVGVGPFFELEPASPAGHFCAYPGSY